MSQSKQLNQGVEKTDSSQEEEKKLTVGALFKAYLIANRLRNESIEKQAKNRHMAPEELGDTNYGGLLLTTTTLISILSECEQEVKVDPQDRLTIAHFALQNAQEISRCSF